MESSEQSERLGQKLQKANAELGVLQEKLEKLQSSVTEDPPLVTLKFSLAEPLAKPSPEPTSKKK